MVAFPLAHISWAVPDNVTRKACDAFLTDVFGAETAFEVLTTPQAVAMRLDREETLMAVGDTMLISIAPMAAGLLPDSVIGSMLRKHARAGMWIGIALSVADLNAARAWVQDRGFAFKSYAGMEDRYFLLNRDDTLGMRLEFLKGDLMNDPRIKPAWNPQWWRDSHPLGIEALHSIGLSTPSLAAARQIFAGKLGWPELSSRHLPDEGADCASFLIGDSVLEAMQPLAGDSPLARHALDIQGIYCLTFKVRSLRAAADYLRGKGFALVGDPDRRIAINPDQAFGRLIYFTEEPLDSRRPLKNLLGQPAKFPA
jgi:catechol 2,3-dioxygenase-like lactoylglutathione lyase family enzyme